ncbi:MAG: T9SS type A sorting domain-containing protein, partial [Candidatus Symbiothrix sp.]|nr:T9SS type A sorting domain-containing protein [Candidatus Symbiothrix sp.]
MYRSFSVNYPAYSFVSAYPNPVSNTLTVDFNLAQYNLSKNLQTNTSTTTNNTGQVSRSSPAFDVRLYNMMGTLVKQAASPGNSLQINVSNLQSGFYS